MTGLRSDFTKSSTVKIHGKRQHSLNKQGKDGRNPGLIAGEQKHRNSVIYTGLQQGCTDHGKHRLPESLFAALNTGQVSVTFPHTILKTIALGFGNSHVGYLVSGCWSASVNTGVGQSLAAEGV